MPNFQFVVDEVEVGERLDVLLARKFPQFSRTTVRQIVQAGGVEVDGTIRKPSYTVRQGEMISANLEGLVAEGPKPEPIPLEILHEDDDCIVVNKPTAMVVHPAKGHWAGTLTSALAHHFQQLSQLGGTHRPGIVHRLDRDTSGVIIVAKNDFAHLEICKQFEARTVQKEYFAICRGRMDRDRDWIRQPIGIHPYQREKMAVRRDHSTSRDAETFYEVTRRWGGAFAVKLLPKTGRTHQLRVHMAFVGTPILCDPLYSGHRVLTRGELNGLRSRSARGPVDHGGDSPVTAGVTELCSESDSRRSGLDPLATNIVLDRLALHAKRLCLVHPRSRQPLEFEAPIPTALTEFMDLLGP